MRCVIDVGDMKVGRDGDMLVTHALGSCLGLMVYEPVAKVGGLLHAMLPLSKINQQKAITNPFMFVDTGVPALFKTLYNLGGHKNQMIVKAAGCGNPLGNNEMFKIGEHNYTLLRRLLSKNDVLLAAHDVGGTGSRTVHFNISTGQVIISKNCQKWEL